jgi:diaminopimelate decarboxylase
MNATLTTFYLIRKSNRDFSYTIFPVKKNKCWKNFKIMRKLLFNYSLYSHPEIENFRV